MFRPIRLALAGVVVVLVSPLAAQSRPSGIIGWGGCAFDSRGREGLMVGVSAQGNTTAALSADGRIFVNGDNYRGAALVPALPPGRRYVDADVSGAGGAAVVDDGDIVVWGAVFNPFFPGFQVPTYPPAPPRPFGAAYVDVDISVNHVVALRSDGVIVAWGNNSSGQCNVPPLPPGLTTVGVRAWNGISAAMLSDGSILMFGMTGGFQGQVPALPPGLAYTDIKLHNQHGMVLRSDGELIAWGDNSQGQCNVPPLPAGLHYTAMAIGSGHNHAARSDGVILTWGTLGGLPPPPSPVLPPGVICTQMACGQNHMIALLSNGKVVTWGSDAFTQGYLPSQEELSQGGAMLQMVDMSSGPAGLAVLSNGGLVDWGGPLLPPASLSAGRTFTRVRHGYWHNAAMTDTGEVLAWGDNSFGQASIPPLPAGSTYVDFACSFANTVLVRSDGQALVVGSNSSGQANVPPLPPGVAYVACDSHENKTILLRSDGQVVCFGQTLSPSQNVVPALPAGLVYTEIAASIFFNAAIRSDGSAVVFGSLGNGPDWRSLPTLPFGVYFVEAAGGNDHVVLRRSDGAVEVCGQVYLTGNSPPPLDPGTSFLQVSAGYSGVGSGRTGSASTYVGIQQGCAGSRQPARLVPRDTPKIGRTLEVTLFDLPLNVAMLAMSFQQPPQPVSLGFLGMPGCEWHVGLDAVAVLVGQSEQAKWLLPIPDLPQLLGATFFHQALVLDPQAGNTFGAVVSNAARGVVGDR
ncbi:MAG: RCC1 domain-containing protein [Planctomycetota bacterium]|jgi:hypothetical protein